MQSIHSPDPLNSHATRPPPAPLRLSYRHTMHYFLPKRARLAQPDRTRLIWIISITVGATVLATTTLVLFHLVRRHRRRQQHNAPRDNTPHQGSRQPLAGRGFRQACLRDPGLTWDEYARKGRFTRSRLLFEEEVQRSAMIRKSQQSRASDRKTLAGSAVSSEQDLEVLQEQVLLLQRSPSRSRSWHGRSKSMQAQHQASRAGGGCSASSPPGQVERGEAGSGQEAGVLPAGPREAQFLADWNSVHASVERTWQLLHGRNRPVLAPLAATGSTTAVAGQPRQTCDDDDQHDSLGQDGPSRPPLVRLKTPPLLSHPIFRDGNAAHRPKHMSLPTELTRAKTEPSRRTGTTRSDGLAGHKDDDIYP